MSYLPLIDLCKQYFRINAGDSDADITRKVHRGLEAVGAEPEATASYLLHLLAADVDGGIPAAMPPEVVKRRTFEALRLLVLQSTTRRPLVIVFEDLHWVDKTTAEFATFLMEYIAGTRVMLACTYRPEFVSTWSRKSYHSVITLTRLAPRESQQMLTFLLGTDQVQDELTTLMLEKAEGVPFFLEELAKSLQETDAIEMHQGQWRLKAETTALQVPDTVEELLMARIDRLPEGARSILQIGAVIGREFRWELLKEIAGLADQELMADRTTLTDAELIYERGLPPQTTCLFKHAFTQEAAYRSLLTARRRDLHRRTALVLETLFSDRLEEHYGLLAHHYRAAEDLEKALDYHCRAAHACQRVYAVEEALEHYTRALEATTALRVEPTGGLSSGLHLQRGMVYAQTGAIAQAQHDFEAALEEARAAGNRADEVQALNELGFLLAGAADYRVAIPLFEAALPIAAALDDKASQVSILSRMSIVYTNRLQFAQALEHGYRALTLARTLEDTRALALAMDSLEVATAMIGDFATIDAIAPQLAAIHRDHGDLWYLQFALYQWCYVPIGAGRWDDAMARLEEALAINRRIGDRGNEPLYPATLGWVHRSCGDYQQALANGRQAVTLAEELGQAEWTAWSEAFLGWTLLEVYALEEAVQHLEQGMAAAERAGALNHLLRCMSQPAPCTSAGSG